MAAIPSNLQFVPNQGTGDQTVNVSPKTTNDIYKGRTSRTTIVDGYIAGVNTPRANVTVIETGYPEYILRESATINTNNSAASISIRGYSNSSALTFSITTDPSGSASLATTYNVQTESGSSLTINNGTAITGDPGNSGQYTFEMVVSIPENTTIEDRTFVITITGSGSTTTTVNILQGAGDPYLYLNTSGTTDITITIDNLGTPQTFNVLSNTTWVFETE